MRSIIWKGFILLALAICLTVASLDLYGTYRDTQLRASISRVQIGMSKEEAIKILGKPTSINISDIPGTYWSYQPRPLTTIRDPFNEGYLLLEMGSDDKVVKVFTIK